MNDYIKVHKYSSNNKEELLKDNLCGCFFCLEVFNTSEIKKWINVEKETAICPNCQIYSVIGEYTGYPIDKESLKKVRDYWFKGIF